MEDLAPKFKVTAIKFTLNAASHLMIFFFSRKSEPGDLDRPATPSGRSPGRGRAPVWIGHRSSIAPLRSRGIRRGRVPFFGQIRQNRHGVGWIRREVRRRLVTRNTVGLVPARDRGPGRRPCQSPAEQEPPPDVAFNPNNTARLTQRNPCSNSAPGPSVNRLGLFLPLIVVNVLVGAL